MGLQAFQRKIGADRREVACRAGRIARRDQRRSRPRCPGDVLRIKCTYDNTLDNAKVGASLLDRGLTLPQDVKLGETTLDEMCLGAFLVIR